MNKEGYKVPDEEFFAAENRLTQEQKKSSLIREEGYKLGQKDLLKLSNLSGSELQSRLKLKYNPEVLLLTIEELKNDMRNYLNPYLAGRISIQLGHAKMPTIYNVITAEERRAWTRPGLKSFSGFKNLGPKSFGGFKNFLLEKFNLNIDQPLPSEVLSWCKSKLGI